MRLSGVALGATVFFCAGSSLASAAGDRTVGALDFTLSDWTPSIETVEAPAARLVQDRADALGVGPLLSLAPTGVAAAVANNNGTGTGRIATNTGKRAGALVVYGDSYSALGNNAFPFNKWSQMVNNALYTTGLRSYAAGGAVANERGYNRTGYGVNTLRVQISKAAKAGAGKGARDFSAIYMGYNDIANITNFTVSKQSYAAGVKSLVDSGAASGQRRVFVALVHDWGRNPGAKDSLRGRVLDWNRTVRAQDYKYGNVVSVDLFTAFERIYKNPGAYGFTNVRTPDRSRSTSTALYFDSQHFGQHGQQVIAQVFAERIGRAANGLAAASSAKASAQALHSGVSGQVAAMSPAALAEAGGVAGFSFGDTAGGEGPASGTSLTGDPEGDRGAGVNVSLDQDTMVGVAVGTYARGGESTAAAWRTGDDATSTGVSVYAVRQWNKLRLSSVVTLSDDSIDHAVSDSTLGRGNHAFVGGTSASLSQTLSYALRGGGVLFTPWVDLTHERRSTDGFTIGNPYISDVSYSSSTLTDTYGSVGVRADVDPYRFGDSSSLRFTAGVSFRQSLQQSDYKVNVSEADIGGSEDESVERDGVARVDASAGVAMDLGGIMTLTADYAIGADPSVGTAQSVLLGMAMRF